MARAGEEDLELHYTAELRTHPPFQAAGTVHFAMDVDDVPAALGSRPDRLSEVRPQERVQLRTVQQIVDLVPLLPTLDDPEQAIEVPKIVPVDVPLRTSVREPQLAEQLVEVPTIVSFSSLQRIAEQHVDIPVPGRGGRISGLQGFPPGQSSTVLPREERISERIVEQTVDFPVFGGLQDFRPGQSSSSSYFPADRLNTNNTNTTTQQHNNTHNNTQQHTTTTTTTLRSHFGKKTKENLKKTDEKEAKTQK